VKNNLKLNKSKSVEIIFIYPKLQPNELPDLLTGIPRVDSIKALGVHINNNITDHVDSVLISCSRNLYALKVLRGYGLGQSHLSMTRIFEATVVSKIAHALPAWYGFLRESEKRKISGFFKKAHKLRITTAVFDIEILIKTADKKLFCSITNNPQHVLRSELPPLKETSSYSLRPKTHNYKLPPKTSTREEQNFIFRTLYSNIY